MRKALIITTFLWSIFTTAQPPHNFYASYGGNADDIGFSCKQTLDGQYIIAGSSSSKGFGQTDVYLMKLDSMGQIIWDKYIGGFGIEVGRSVLQLSDSGFVVVGYTNSYGAGGYDVFLFRTDKNGNMVWQKSFGGVDWDFGNDLTIGSDGNIYVVGYTYSFGSGKKDGLFLKYDLSGNLLLNKCFGGVENEELSSIINTNDNFLASVGYTESYKDSLGDFYFLKLDLNGDTLFTKSYGNQGKSLLNDLVQFPSGDYILVGAETYTDLPFTQSYRGFMNSTGSSFLWEGNSFTYNDDESWKSVTKSIYGSQRVSTLRDFDKAGFRTQGSIFSNFWNDFYPAIVNEFGGTEDEHFYSHEGTRDGGFICVGSTRSYNSLGLDIFVIKLDSSIFNYVSIVGLPKPSFKSNLCLITVTETLIQIELDPMRLPVSIEIISLDGNTVRKVNVINDKLEMDRQLFFNGLYIFKFNYPDYNSEIKKVLIQ